MKKLTQREIEKRYPLSEAQRQQAELERRHRKVLRKIYGPVVPRHLITGKLVELKTTRDRYCEITGIISSVRPPVREGSGDGGWYVWDGSSDTKTVWARDVCLVIEAEGGES
jgi:hypothetical protein